MDNSSSPKGWNDALAAFEEYLLVKGRAENSVSSYISSLKTFGRFYREELKKPGPYVIRLGDRPSRLCRLLKNKQIHERLNGKLRHLCHPRLLPFYP